jgi:hypothetical protein
MNINFERLRLQMHMRQLYEQLGAMDAEIVIADAFARELARHDTMQAQQAQLRKIAAAGTPNGETRDSISKQQFLQSY